MRNIAYLLIFTITLFTACLNNNKVNDCSQQKEAIYNKFVRFIEQGENDSLRMFLCIEYVNYIPPTSPPLLQVAIKNNNIVAAKILITKGANPNIRANDEYETTPLMECTNNNQLEIAKLLLETNNTDINIVDNFGDPAINWSVYWNLKKMTQLFLKYNANTNLKSLHSPNTISVALKEWNYEIVEILINNGIYLTEIDSGRLIVEATKVGNLPQVKELIEQNPLLTNQTDESGTPIISIAAKNGELEIVRYLYEKGANINQLNPVGQSPLSLAARFGNEDVVEYLLFADANINHTDTIFKLTPLIAASIGGNINIGEMLIVNGANINDCDGQNNHSPLLWAVIYNNLEFVKVLVQNGADLNIKSLHGFTAIEVAQDSVRTFLINYINQLKIQDNIEVK